MDRDGRAFRGKAAQLSKPASRASLKERKTKDVLGYGWRLCGKQRRFGLELAQPITGQMLPVKGPTRLQKLVAAISCFQTVTSGFPRAAFALFALAVVVFASLTLVLNVTSCRTGSSSRGEGGLGFGLDVVLLLRFVSFPLWSQLAGDGRSPPGGHAAA